MLGPLIGVETIGAGIGAAGACLGYAVRGRSAAVLAPSIWRGSPSRPVVALTFDDGPSESTSEILRLLAKHDVRATFFMCGANVRRLPSVAREVRSAGHEIGNHSDTHPRFDFKSPAFMYGELARAQESIAAATGFTPALFRAPYGVRWFGLRGAQRELGLTGVMWTIIGRDWSLPAPRIVRRLLGATNGAILCLHDGRTIQPAPDIGATVEALRFALPPLIERGFQFETVSELASLSLKQTAQSCPIPS
jgi:peptidoglycan/xylan/chitin deacetylase (PgdA/CDA1 family)